MRSRMFAVAAAIVVATGCFSPKEPAGDAGDAGDAGVHLDSATGIPAPVASVPAAGPRLLVVGDTFDLRTFGGIDLRSRAADSIPCYDRPPISEVLAILDTAYYSVTRVIVLGCGETTLDTVEFSSSFRLDRDTVQFYLSEGNEIEGGMQALVTPDALVGLNATPKTRPGYARRHPWATGARQQSQ